MAILSTLDFSAGSLPAGVTANGGASQVAGGIAPQSTHVGRCVQASNGTAYFAIDLATIAGGSVGLTRSVGGVIRVNSLAAASSSVRHVRIQGNAGAQFLCQIASTGAASTFVWQDSNGVQSSVLSVNLADGRSHSFHIGVAVASASYAGSARLWVDGVLEGWAALNYGAINYGAGPSTVWLGDHAGATGNTQSADYDAIYISDGLDPESPRRGLGLTGPSGVVAATSRTVTLSSPAASPSWATDDPDVATVSGGVVTLQQSSGGVVSVSDGQGSARQVEFAPRVVSFSVGPYSMSGSDLTVPVALASVSDGYAYPEIRPAVMGVHSRTRSVSGSASSWTATLEPDGTGAYSAYVGGTLRTLAADSPTPVAAGRMLRRLGLRLGAL